ncbi:MAG: serine/threonine protein phosphatase [Ruminococcaceae bacterium]|nr:serine/threonine protein phosphatase [Oscillospiraceae bacterium]
MALFTIGDTHLSFGTDKPMDIFKGWSDYTDRLENTWRAIVKEEDTVVIPGDVSWGMSLQSALPDLQFLNSLPGTKILGKGNHDYWWETMRKMTNFIEQNELSTIKILFNNAYRIDDFTVCGTRGWFFDAETENVEKILNREAGRLRMSLDAAMQLGGEPIVFLHYPPLYEDKICREIYDVLLEYNVKRCYFGHLHGLSGSKYSLFERDGIRFSLVAADFLSFCPKIVSL